MTRDSFVPTLSTMGNAAEVVKTIREATGLSQEAFGAKVGKSRKTVIRWELGQTEPRYEDIVRIQALLQKTTKKRRD